MNTWAALLWLALMSQDELAARAAASSRPVQCRPAEGVWERARSAAANSQCDRLARAQTLLGSDPKQSLELAESLRETKLGAFALAVSGQAHLELGAYDAAFRSLESAARDPRVLADPRVRHALAVAAAFSGRVELSAELYRTLLAERAVMPRQQRERVLLEVALAELRLGAARLAASLELVELMESTQEGAAGTELERALGALVRARAALPLAPRAAPSCAGLELVFSLPSARVRVPAEERLALQAIACEATEPERALELWQKYAATALAAPWKTWALQRATGLVRQGR